jgi:hypothetical protein
MADDFLTYEQAVGAPSEGDTLSYEQAAGGSEKPSGMLSRAPDEGYLSGLMKGATTATISGLAQIPGQFGNLRETSKMLSGALLEKAGIPREQIERNRQLYAGPADLMPTGAEIAKPILGVTGEYEPESYAGKLGMTGLETALSMLGPGSGSVKLGQRALSRGLPAAEREVPKLGFEALKETAKMAPSGFLPGVAAQAAYDVTGNPLYGFGAAILAGGAQPAGLKAAEKLTTPIVRPILEDIPGLKQRFAGERRRMAGEKLEGMASDIEGVRAGLWPEKGPVPQEIVPGSKPTLGQVTGDIGFLEAERQARTADSEPFNLLEAEQNAARRQALQAIPKPDAEAMKVTELVTNQARALEQGLEQAETQLQLDAVRRAEALGERMPPEELGETLRRSIEGVREDVKKQVSELYKAVDPEGTISLVVRPVREEVTDIVSKIDPYGSPINENEARIYGKIAEMPDVLPFKSLVELDKDITQSMKEAGIAGQGISRERLIETKSAVQKAINNAIENQEAYEAAAVKRGEMAADDTVEARVRAWVDQFQRERAGEAPPATPEPLQPSFDPEAAGRLTEAKEAFKDYATTYRSQPVQGAIKTTGFNGQYQIPSGAVPGRAVVTGGRGYEAAKAFIDAAKSSADSIFAVRETLLNDLRGRVRDGVLTPNAINAWKTKFDGALRAFDEYQPGFANSFDDAANAADRLAEFGAQRKATEEAFQKSAAAKFLGAADATEVEARVANILRNEKTGVSQMRDLVSQIKTDPAALEGLRKAAADWIVRKMSNVAEAATFNEKLLSSAGFQKLVRDSSPVLQQLFTTEQMNTLRAVAKDLERADRSVQATRIKGSPGTAKDVKQFFKKGAEGLRDTGILFGMFEIVKDATERGGIAGALTTGIPLAGLYGFKYWRGTGVEKVQNLVRDALLDPGLARQLLTEVPRDKLPARANIVGKALQKSFYQPSETKKDEREEYAKGGKVYPAKKMSHMERAAAKAFNDIANETKPLMDVPDEHIAHALGMAAV